MRTTFRRETSASDPEEPFLAFFLLSLLFPTRRDIALPSFRFISTFDSFNEAKSMLCSRRDKVSGEDRAARNFTTLRNVRPFPLTPRGTCLLHGEVLLPDTSDIERAPGV